VIITEMIKFSLDLCHMYDCYATVDADDRVGMILYIEPHDK